MTRVLLETASAPQQVATGPQEAAINPLPPEPIGFNGGSTEAGVEKATVKPIFELGELKVSSLTTTNSKVFGQENMGSKTCDRGCQTYTAGCVSATCQTCGICGTNSCHCTGSCGCSGSAQSVCCC